MCVSLSERAYELIKREILTCALEPGRQVAQRQLVERYGLGTTPVREALQRLSQEGLVQPIPRFGYTISYVTVSDVHEIYELRLVLEVAAARLAATRATESQLEGIALVADQTYVPPRQGVGVPPFHVYNAGFHRLIAAASRNQRLLDATCRVLDELMRIFYLGLDLSQHADTMRDEHQLLVEALRKHDVELAEQRMHEQISGSLQRVLDAMVHRLGVLGQSIPLAVPGVSRLAAGEAAGLDLGRFQEGV